MDTKLIIRSILLINDLIPHSGSFNMEFDSWLFDMVKLKKIKALLRIYEWKEPTITYGRFQKLEDFNIEKCKKDNISLIKRPTGGRAILHFNEITFSFVIQPFYLKPYNFRNLFIFIAGNIVKALQSLKIDARLNLTPFHYESSNSCFNSISQYEIIDKNNNKLAGIAQYFTSKGALIQGSIPLDDNSKIKKYLKDKSNIKKFTNQLIESDISKEKLRTAIISNFSVKLKEIFI